MQNSRSDSYDEDTMEEAGVCTASDDTFPSPPDLNVNLHYVHFLLLDQNHLRLNSRKLSRGSRISRRETSGSGSSRDIFGCFDTMSSMTNDFVVNFYLCFKNDIQ